MALATVEQIRDIPLDAIVADSKGNPRKKIDAQKLADLVASIKSKGIMVPVMVRPKQAQWDLICGFRRLQAARQLKLETVPAIVRSMTDEEVAQARVIENLQREDIDIVDESRGFAETLTRFGWRAEDVAEKIGKSADYVRKRLAILGAPDYVLKELSAGNITLGHALILRGIQDKAEQKNALQEVLDQGYSVRQLHTELSQERKITKKTPFDTAACFKCQWFGGQQRELLATELGKGVASHTCHNKACYEQKLQTAAKDMAEKYKKEGVEVHVMIERKGSGHHPGDGSMVEMVDKAQSWQPSRKDPKKCKDCEKRVVIIYWSWDDELEVDRYCRNPKCSNWKVDRSREAGAKRDRERMKKQQQAFFRLVDRARKKIDQPGVNRLLLLELLHGGWQKGHPTMKRFVEIHEIDVSKIEKGKGGWAWMEGMRELVLAKGPGKYPGMIKTLVLLNQEFRQGDELRKIVGPLTKPDKRKKPSK